MRCRARGPAPWAASARWVMARARPLVGGLCVLGCTPPELICDGDPAAVVEDFVAVSLLGEPVHAQCVLATRGDVRVDGALAADGRFAYTIDGPPGTYSLKVARSFEGVLCHPGTAACEPVVKKAGEVLAVTFTRGRLLVGKATS